MERVVSELCEGLAGEGHAVKAVVASRDGKFSDETINGVEVVRLRSRGSLFSQPLISGLREEIRAFRPDVVQFHVPNPLALETGFCGDIPTCLTIHAEAGGLLRRPIDRALTERFARRSQALIFSSTQMASRWGLDPRARQAGGPIVRVIPFGFRFDYLKTVGSMQDPTLLLFVGRLVKYKGIETLIQAMTRVEGKLAIIGTGPLQNYLAAMAEQLGVRDNVRFLGAVPDSELIDWYERCAAYVQPSISTAEAFGISMLEAMHVGRPIVSTDLPTGVRSVNQHLHTGLVVPPRDPVALSAALNTLLKDQALARKLGSAAREHEKTFDAQLMIFAHLDLYRRLVGKVNDKANFEADSLLRL